ncbi:unnamed protein product [Lactuca saligna]|uniref:Uncharacterized protein n=1 Tax=Lactuca saligna TaxID=75948 RepID=A0AA36E676_LACSI|nr:unnamed protein product [Lactuca saligna]
MSCKYAILRLNGEASISYDGLKAKRKHEGKKKITSWESLKHKIRRRYVPTNYPIIIYQKLSESWQNKLLDVMDYDESLGETIITEEPTFVQESYVVIEYVVNEESTIMEKVCEDE